MRRLELPQVRQLALGSGILSAGGGGDPRAGVQMAEVALRDCGPVELIDLDDLAYLYIRIYESMLYADVLIGRPPDIGPAERAARALVARGARQV